MTLIDVDRIITAQLYDDEYEEFKEKKMSIIDYINAYTDEGVTEADVVAQTRWIPVSERLPEEDKQVLVTECFTGISGKKIYSISLASRYGDDWVTVDDEYKLDPSRYKVVAWMPLPEPYKAESEEV